MTLKSRKWAGHVARMEEIRVCKKFWADNLKRKDHWEDLVIDGRYY
jgi:hypothetical protein